MRRRARRRGDEQHADPAARQAADHRPARTDAPPAPAGGGRAGKRRQAADAVDEPLRARREPEIARHEQHDDGPEHTPARRKTPRGCRRCARSRGSSPQRSHALDDLASTTLRRPPRRAVPRACGYEERRRGEQERQRIDRHRPGAVTSCTSQPARLNEPNSATDSLAVSLLLPSMSCSLSMSVGRYD